jgi:alpha-tubulin suppressor-like RCC1 family protein
MALLCALAACGGGGSSDSQSQAPLTPPPTTGTVSIPVGSEILALGVGASDQIIYVMPGEITAHRVELLNDDAGARYDVTLTEGGSLARAVEFNGRWVIVVDSQGLAGGTSHAYRLQIRNRTTGGMAEIYGPINVLTPTNVGGAQITEAGGTIVFAGGLGQVVFEPQAGAQSLGVTVLTAESPGGTLLRVKFDRDVSADDRNASIHLNLDAAALAGGSNTTQADGSQRNKKLSLSPGFVELAGVGRDGVFTLFGGFRLALEPRPLNVLARVTCGPNPASPQRTQVCGLIAPAWKLSRRGESKVPPQAVEPVLFVHGYTLTLNGPVLGGGEDTWGAFPRLAAEQIVNLATGHPVQPYEFQWATNAKFEQVADELASAVNVIFLATGRKVTIVAHSFGGNLVRTMLQDLGSTDQAQSQQVASKVRQVVTLGTPHSGIALPVAPSVDFLVGTVRLPLGRDSALLGACGQISCHQMGADSLSDDEAALVGIPVSEGLLAARLSLLDAHPIAGAVPFAVGIGLGLQLDVASSLVSVTSGDGLISFDGQRFKPDLRFHNDRNSADPYLGCSGAAGAPVREEVLVEASRLPAQAVIGIGKGLVHTALQRASLTRDLVNLDEAAVIATEHPSFKFVKGVIESGVCAGEPQIVSEPHDAAVQAGQAATFEVTALGLAPLSYQWFKGAEKLPNATAASYTIESVLATDDGARISVVVSNAVGSRRSTSALLTVSTATPGPSAQRISTGEYSTCAVTPAGEVKCWGAGPLGNGTDFDSSAPVGVQGLGTGVIAVAVGADFCALTSTGGVKCWGDGVSGDGAIGRRLTPVDVAGLSAGAKAIAAGSEHMCAITATGGVQCWGVIVHRPNLVTSLFPADVPGLRSGVVAIAAGLEHTCALTTAGSVKCWGSNLVGQLGDGTTEQRLTPVEVVGLDSGVVAITAGVIHTCAITRVGAAVCWGAGTGGRLGDGMTQNISRLEPVGVSGLTSGAMAISAGSEHTCALVYGGAVKCWGSNYKGALGDGTSETRSTPIDVVGLSSGVIAIDAGAFRTCALMQAGGAKCWGWNVAGSLGDGTDVDRSAPVDVIEY